MAMKIPGTRQTGSSSHGDLFEWLELVECIVGIKIGNMAQSSQYKTKQDKMCFLYNGLASGVAE
jgi:hypothetical protein